MFWGSFLGLDLRSAGSWSRPSSSVASAIDISRSRNLGETRGLPGYDMRGGRARHVQHNTCTAQRAQRLGNWPRALALFTYISKTFWRVLLIRFLWSWWVSRKQAAICELLCSLLMGASSSYVWGRFLCMLCNFGHFSVPYVVMCCVLALLRQ